MTDPTFEPHEQTPNPSYAQVMLDTKGLPAHTEGESVWRHPLFVLLVGALAVMTAALVSVVFALVVVNGTKNDARDQLSCSRKYSTATSQAQAKVLGHIGAAQSTILTAVAAAASDDRVAVDAQLALIPVISKNLNDSANALDQAIGAQEASLTICT
jgi:hypothetical protein